MPRLVRLVLPLLLPSIAHGNGSPPIWEVKYLPQNPGTGRVSRIPPLDITQKEAHVQELLQRGDVSGKEIGHPSSLDCNCVFQVHVASIRRGSEPRLQSAKIS